MKEVKTGLIGAGNIARAIIGGLIDSGLPPSCISAADPSANQLALLPPGVMQKGSNRQLAKEADVILLCVKPGLIMTVAEDIKALVKSKLVISVAAGVSTGSLEQVLGSGVAIIRCMPNTPALVRHGMTGLFANPFVTDAQRQIAREILGAVGKTRWFDAEDQLDAVTAVSGSGPAYFFLVMEALQAAAEELALPPEVARELVVQTALGAAYMASQSAEDAASLRRNVTSPGGTTEAAIKHLLAAGLPGDFSLAVQAAFERSRELAKTAGK